MQTLPHQSAHASHDGHASGGLINSSTSQGVLEVRLRDLYNGTECAGLEAYLFVTL